MTFKFYDFSLHKRVHTPTAVNNSRMIQSLGFCPNPCGFASTKSVFLSLPCFNLLQVLPWFPSISLHLWEKAPVHRLLNKRNNDLLHALFNLTIFFTRVKMIPYHCFIARVWGIKFSLFWHMVFFMLRRFNGNRNNQLHHKSVEISAWMERTK